MDKKAKQNLIHQNRTHDQDTGSRKVQIALLQHQIKVLTQHLKKNVKDIVARRILLKKVAKNRKFLKQNALKKSAPSQN